MATISKRSSAPLVLLLAVLLCATLVGAFKISSAVPSRENPNRAEVTVSPGAPLLVTFVGDSLDAGLYASETSRGFHPLTVDSWRSGGPVSDTPLNTLGGTVRNALGNPTFPRDQDLVVIELGTNDFSLESHRTFRQNYDKLLDRLREASPDAALLCVGLFRPTEAARRFDTIVKDLCEGRGGVFRSISDIAENPEMRGPEGVMTASGLSDTFHPNDLGHRGIADRLLDAVSVDRQS